VKKIEKTAFGPVPSRRLGQSLGINNIPPKICTYSCVYCQLGRTLDMRLERGAFYEPDKILRDAEDKVRQARHRGEVVDYLTFVPDGEPTLDLHLGEEIKPLKKLGVKIGVITNSSLIWKTDVRDDLIEADWVSLKIDALSPDVWRKINRPHGSLSLDQILEGISEFARTFKGELATETMLVQGLNDQPREIEKISAFVARIKPKKSYIAVPIRPPTEKWVKPPEEYSINRAYHVFKEKSIDTEYLIGYEGNAFAFTGNIKEDLLSIAAVHPMRDDAVRGFLKKANSEWEVIENLLNENKLVEIKFENKVFYIRKMSKKSL
jgi:wyosine [tRNA(Phe)-imidazoG37] synthetase (radical SAM superfamily)